MSKWPSSAWKNPKVPPFEDRPCCRFCGKRLALDVERYDVVIEAEPPEMLVRWSYARRGPFGYTRRWVSVWTGHFGGYGDDRFCGKNCAWRWAIRHAPKAKVPAKE